MYVFVHLNLWYTDVLNENSDTISFDNQLAFFNCTRMGHLHEQRCVVTWL